MPMNEASIEVVHVLLLHYVGLPKGRFAAEYPSLAEKLREMFVDRAKRDRKYSFDLYLHLHECSFLSLFYLLCKADAVLLAPVETY